MKTKITMSELNESELKKLIRLLTKILTICPESDLPLIQSDLDQAKKLLESRKG